MSAGRELARLKMIALLQELPIDADLELSVKGLSREEYNLLDGRRELSLWFDHRLWTKDVSDEGVIVEYYTSEPPLTDWDEVAAEESLRLIQGGRA